MGVYLRANGEVTVDVQLDTTTVGRNSTATLFTADKEGTCTFTAYLWAVTTGQYTYARIYKNGTQIYEFNNNLHSGDSLVSTTFDVDVGDIISAESYCQYYDNNLHDISVQQQVEGIVQKELKNAYIGAVPPIDLLSDIVVYYSMEGNLNDDGPSGFNLNVTTGSYTGATNWIETSSSFGATNTSATYPTNSSVTTTIWMNGTGGLYLGSDNYSGWGMNTELQSSWSGAYVVVGGRQFGATQNTSLSGWNMITGVFDYSAHTVTYYQNGNLITSTSTNSGGLRGGVVIGIGGASSKIGITFVTANAMTQAEIQKFYNASKGIYGL